MKNCTVKMIPNQFDVTFQVKRFQLYFVYTLKNVFRIFLKTQKCLFQNHRVL